MRYDTRPPESLSGLITLAIADGRNPERGLYPPLAEAWHRSYPAPPGAPPDRCHVCLAGCMIAATLHASPADDICVYNATRRDTRRIAIDDADWRYALYNLNGARQGLRLGAIVTLGHVVDADTTRQLR